MKKPARPAKATPLSSKAETGKSLVNTAARNTAKATSKPAAKASAKNAVKPAVKSSRKLPAAKAAGAAAPIPQDSALKAGRAGVSRGAELVPEPGVKKAGKKPASTEAQAARKIMAAKPVPANIPPAPPAGADTQKKLSQANGAAAPKEKERKPKLVRDSFTMPESEYRVLGEVKKSCIKAGFEVKKSQLLRVGVALIRQMDTDSLKLAINALAPLKAGRPPKDK